jgi:hypothetical protein
MTFNQQETKTMHFAELILKTEDEITAWLTEDARLYTPESGRLADEAWEATTRRELTDEQVNRWCNANRRAGERLQAEADALRKYVRCKRAGITGVVDGGPDAA